MTTTSLSPTLTLGELVTRRPARAELFERLKLDYCCGGGQTLEEACARRGLDAETICRLIEDFEAAPADVSAHVEDHDWQRASLAELCDHIVAVHHAALRRDLPKTAELLDSVIRVHGPVHRWLHDLPRVFVGLRDELEVHMESEERGLFPAIRALDRGAAGEAPVDAALLTLHEDEHREVGDALAALRELTGDYDVSRALCRTHRRLLEALRDLELELHQHIHEENNILFPRARAAAAGISGHVG